MTELVRNAVTQRMIDAVATAIEGEYEPLDERVAEYHLSRLAAALVPVPTIPKWPAVGAELEGPTFVYDPSRPPPIEVRPGPTIYSTMVTSAREFEDALDYTEQLLAIFRHRPTWEERLAIAIEQRRVRTRIRYAWQDATHRAAHSIAALRGEAQECDRW